MAISLIAVNGIQAGVDSTSLNTYLRPGLLPQEIRLMVLHHMD